MSSARIEHMKQAALLRKLQGKLRKQRQELNRSHQYDLQQKLKEQTEKYENSMETANNERKQENDTNQASIQALKAELERNIAENTKHKLDKQNITQKYKELEDLNKELKYQKEVSEHHQDQLHADIEDLHQRNDALQFRNDEMLSDKNELKEKYRKESIKIQNNINQWIKSQQHQINSPPKKHNFKEVEEKLFALRNTAKKFISNKFEEWSVAKQNMNKLSDELKEKQEYIEELKNSLENVTTNLQIKSDQLERIENDYDKDLTYNINEYKINIKNLEKEINSEIRNREKIEAELNEITETNNELLQHIKELEKTNAKYEVETNHYQTVIEELKTKKIKNEEMLYQYQQDLFTNSSTLQMNLRNVIAEKKELRRRLDEKSNELIELKTQLHSTQRTHRKRINSLEQALQNSLNELKDKTKQCQTLQTKVENIFDHLNTQLPTKNRSSYAN